MSRVRTLGICVLMAALFGCGDRLTPPVVISCAHATASIIAHALCPKPSQLVFGIAPYFSESIVKKQYQPIIAHLSDTIGVDMELMVPQEYDALVTGLQDGSIHIASLPPIIYVTLMKERPDLVYVATQIANGVLGNTAYIMVATNSGISSVDDLEGRRFCFVSRRSASGFNLPLAYLLDQGIDPESFLGAIIYTGSHHASLVALVEGECDAAAIYSSALKVARDEGVDVGDIRILAKTGFTYQEAIVAQPTVPWYVVDALRAELLSLSTATTKGRQVLTGELWFNGWATVDDAMYDPIREVLDMVQAYLSAHPGFP